MALTLPYFYRVDSNNVVGASTVGWTETGDTAGDTSIVSTPADVSAYTLPVDNVLYADISSGQVKTGFTLPDTFDTTDGYRLCVWWKGSTADQNGINFLASNAALDDAGVDSIHRNVNLVGSSAGYTRAYNNGSSTASTNMGTHASLGADSWIQDRLQFDPNNTEVSSWMYQSNNGFQRHASGALSYAWSPSITTASIISLWASGGSSFRDDIYLAGFWIGALTDDWPDADDIPEGSTDVDVAQTPSGVVAVAGYDPEVHLGQHIVVVQSPVGALSVKDPVGHYVKLNVRVAPGLGEIDVSGYDPVVEFPTNQDPSGAVSVLGYDPVVVASASAVRLFFKFKDENGFVWTREIDGHPPLVTVTEEYIASSTEESINADATTGAFDVIMPTLTGRGGYEYTIKKIDSSANAVTVVGTIDGDTNFDLEFKDEVITIKADSIESGWWIQ